MSERPRKPDKSRFLETPVEPFRIEPGAPVDEVLRRMERISFQGRNLAAAHRVWQRMLDDDLLIFLGVAGALSAGGLRLIIAELIRRRAVDCVVSTGANLYHDLHETRGHRHFLGSPAPTTVPSPTPTSIGSTTRSSTKTSSFGTTSGSRSSPRRSRSGRIPPVNSCTGWASTSGTKRRRTGS